MGCSTSVEQCTFDTAIPKMCGGDAIELEASKVGSNTSVRQWTFNTATIIGAEEMQLCWGLARWEAVPQ